VKGHRTAFLHLANTARLARPLLWAALLTLCIAFASPAQDTGYIAGTISDKSGAAIVSANVVLTSTAGSLTRTTTTNDEGAYVIAGLPGGTYDLSVTATGFQKYSAHGVVLEVAQKTRIDIQMTVGAVTEEVVVTGESVEQVETTSSEIGTTITGKQINQLVLNGRNFTQLVNLTPGVVNQTGQDEGTVGINGNVSYSINGGRTEYNNWEIDGGDNMDNGSNATLNVYPNPEAIAEVKVLTSNYGAQYGRNASGTVEVETKSGGSSFHGSAFEYLRNDIFNARSWDEGADPTQPKAPYKKHDFGYTIGGPVFIPNHYNSDKKKTFFFFSQEWRREKNPSTILQNVPSDAERAGNFSELCPGDDCPNLNGFNPAAIPVTAVGQALEGLIPVANTVNNGFPAVLQTVSLPTTWREELVRIDHNLTKDYRLTFRYIHDSWQTQVANPLWGNGTTSFQDINTKFVGPGSSFVARLTANVTPTLLNEFVASYTSDHIFLTALNNPELPAGLPIGALFANGFGGKLPSVDLFGNNAYGGEFGQDTGYFPWNNANPTYTYRDNVTKILGNHTFQFGAYFAAGQKNEENSPNVQGILSFDPASPVSSGNSFADLLAGNIAQYKQWNSIVKYYNRYKILEPYFQDDWRISKKFTLNLGLRLSLFGTYRERYKNAFNFEPTAFAPGGSPVIDADGSVTGSSGAFIPDTGNPFNGIIQCGGKGGSFSVPGFSGATVGPSSNAGCLKGHLFNPAPRIGFAWDPKGDGKMAIRGGYGVFFEHTNGNEGNTESLEGSPPVVLTASQFNVVGYDAIGGGLLFPLSVNSIPTKAVWPYVQQWNLNVQKEIPGHIVASVAYVGSKGTHLTLLSNSNQLFPVAASANPYAPGEPIITADPTDPTVPFNTVCPDPATLAGGTVNGLPITGPTAVNLNLACGGNPDPFRSNFPGFGNINRIQDSANSVYHALQFTAKRSVGDLDLSVAYTYSHSIDDSSDRFDTAFVNAFDIAANRANSNFDQRHNFSMSYVWSLPFFKGSGLRHTLLGGWQASGIIIAQTGTPFTVTNGTTFGDNAGIGNGTGTGSRPDLVGDPHASLSATEFPDTRGPLLFNPAAFALPTGLTVGNVGRNTLFLPGRVNVDIGTFKRFAISEHAGFEFRWEIFNLFNHTQFGNGTDSVGHEMDTNDPGSNANGSDFLHATSAHAPRRMQFGLRFYF
jgi:Carboxypeptidase regulatory-like domain/TonB-dependent Receptor Plug Domain